MTRACSTPNARFGKSGGRDSSTGSLVVALLSPPGRGALAVVGVAGPNALEAVARCFEPRGRGLAERDDAGLAERDDAGLAERDDAAIVFGTWKGAGCGTGPVRVRNGDAGATEELIVVKRSATRLEVHPHGGLAASERVIADLVAAGATRLAWPDWLAATGMAKDEAEDEVEIREALAAVGGPKAARILCRQLTGALHEELGRIEGLRRAGDHAASKAAVDRLVRASRVGLRLTRPWRVVVAGPVNAGKSSLVNALAGYARSIVSAEPGTTRDLLTTRIVLDGWEIDLVDTAGLRGVDLADASPTERAGIDRALAATAAADLILRVSRAGIERLASAAVAPEGVPELPVLSRCDLLPADAAPPPGTIHTSAVTGEGIAELAEAIIRRLVPEERDEPALLSGAVPVTPRQVRECLQRES